MITIGEYVRAGSLQEAYALNQKKANAVIGGMLWLKQQRRHIAAAIDLSDLGLDRIEEEPDLYRIGAMVTLRQIETHPGLQALTCGAVSAALRPIVGVQFRNMATVGGSLFGRYGFSDVLTLFMAIGANVELYKRGIVTVEEFAKMPYDRDILTHVMIPKVRQRTVYLSQRNTGTDFPVLNCCVSVTEKTLRCCVGATPMRAVCLEDTEKILTGPFTEEKAEAFAASVQARVTTGSNMRGGREYRSALVKTLTRRALLEIGTYGVWEGAFDAGGDVD